MKNFSPLCNNFTSFFSAFQLFTLCLFLARILERKYSICRIRAKENIMRSGGEKTAGIVITTTARMKNFLKLSRIKRIYVDPFLELFISQHKYYPIIYGNRLQYSILTTIYWPLLMAFTLWI